MEFSNGGIYEIWTLKGSCFIIKVAYHDAEVVFPLHVYVCDGNERTMMVCPQAVKTGIRVGNIDTTKTKLLTREQLREHGIVVEEVGNEEFEA